MPLARFGITVLLSAVVMAAVPACCEEGAGENAALEACYISTCNAGPRPGAWPAGEPVHFWVEPYPEGCAGDLTYFWDFGDGATSTERYPVHTYGDHGGAYVDWSVTVTGSDGGTCNAWGDIRPMGADETIRSFYGVPDVGQSPLEVRFYAVGHDDRCPLPAYTWDFGDGGTSTDESPVHTYLNPGPDAVFRTVQMATAHYNETLEECYEVTWSDTLLIQPPCGLSICEAFVSEWVDFGIGTLFSAEVYDDCQGSISYLWDLGDGNASTEERFYHWYETPGTYDWSLTATVPEVPDPCVVTGQTEVRGCALDCAPVVPAASQTGMSVWFQSNVTSVNCVDPITYDWDFGDQSPHSSAQNPSHIYEGSGTYTWSLVATSGEGWCEASGTISVGCLQVGGLSFCADTISQDGDTYTLSGGNMNVNGMLWFEGSATVTLDGPGAATGRLTTSGDVSVRHGGGEETLFAAPPTLAFDVEGDAGRLLPDLSDDFALSATLAGLPLFAAGSIVTLDAGGLTLTSALFMGVPGVLTLAQMEAEIRYAPAADKELVRLSMVNGELTPSLKFFSIDATYDPARDRLEGSVSVGFPFIPDTPSVTATIRVEANCFDGFFINVGLSTGIPLGASGVSINGFLLDVNHLCQLHRFQIFMGGDLGITSVPSYVLSLNGMGLGYHAPYLLIYESGDVKVLGYPVSGTECRVDFNPARGAIATRGYMTLGGMLDGRVNAFLGLRRHILYGSASGTLQVTDFQCSWVNVPCRVFRSAVKNSVGLPYVVNDMSMEMSIARSGSGVWAGDLRGTTLLGPIQGALLMHYQDGDWSLLAGRDYANLYEIARAPEALPSANGTERSLTLAEGVEPVLFAVAADTAVPDIYLVTPAGQTVTKENVDTFPGFAYAEDGEMRTAHFLVDFAWPGTWTLGEDGLGSGELTFVALTPGEAPLAGFTSVQQSGHVVNVEVDVDPADEETTVSIFASPSAEPGTGDIIAWALPVNGRTASTAWDTLEWPEGTYYLQARTDDGRHVPSWTVYPDAIGVDRGTLAAPTGLTGSRSGSTATVRWTPSLSPAAAGYTVRFTAAPEVPGYTEERSAALEDELEIDGLDPEVTYRFCVVAYDGEGNFSLESAPWTAEPGPDVPGDCDGSGAISIGEVQRVINMFLGSEPAGCGADCDGNGAVSIGEVQKVINGFLGASVTC